MKSLRILVLGIVVLAGAEPSKAVEPNGHVDRNGDALPPHAVARLGSLRFHHAGIVNALVFSPDHKTLASVGEDRTVRLWQLDSGKELQRLHLGETPAAAIAFAPDGQQLAVAVGDTTRFWVVDTGKALPRKFQHPSRTYRIAISPDGKTLATGGADNNIRLWNVASGEEIKQLKGHTTPVFSLAFSPDGSTLASACCYDLDGRKRDDSLRLWDVATGREKHVVPGAERFPLTFGPKGNVLAVGSQLYDVALAPRDLKRIPNADKAEVAWSPALDLAALSFGRGVDLIDVATGERRFRIGDAFAYNQTALAFSLDGKLLATGNDGIRFWDVLTGKEKRPVEGHSGAVLSVAFFPDGKRVVTGSTDRSMRFWDPGTGRQLHRSNEQKGAVSCVVVSPDGKLLASRCLDGTVRLWDAATGQELRQCESVQAKETIYLGTSHCPVVFSPDNRYLASTRTGNEGVCIWEAATGKLARRLEHVKEWVVFVALAPDGKTLASIASFPRPQAKLPGQRSYTLRLWETATGKLTNVPLHACDHISSCVFAPDSQTLIATTDKIAVLAVASGKLIQEWKSESWAVTASPDGKTLATAGPRDVILWDPVTGKERGRFRGNQRGIGALAFSADGTRLASAAGDGTALIWDVTSLEKAP